VGPTKGKWPGPNFSMSSPYLGSQSPSRFPTLSWLSAWLATWYTSSSLRPPLALGRLPVTSAFDRPSVTSDLNAPLLHQLPVAIPNPPVSVGPSSEFGFTSCMLGCRTQIRRLYSTQMDFFSWNPATSLSIFFNFACGSYT
jgi:hypothetical protein